MEPTEGDIDCASRPSVLCSEFHRCLKPYFPFWVESPEGDKGLLWFRTRSLQVSLIPLRVLEKLPASWNFSEIQIQIHTQIQWFRWRPWKSTPIRNKFCQALYMSAIALVDSLLLMMWTFWELARPTVLCTSDTCLREGVKKNRLFLGKSPKLWVGGGQES